MVFIELSDHVGQTTTKPIVSGTDVYIVIGVNLFRCHLTISTMDVRILLLSACLIAAAQAEMFTAMAHMRGLAQLEGDLLAGLKSFITAEEQRLNDLKKFADEVEAAQKTVRATSVHEHLNDPINSVLLISRFYNGWRRLSDIVYRDNSIGKLSQYTRVNIVYVPVHRSDVCSVACN